MLYTSYTPTKAVSIGPEDRNSLKTTLPSPYLTDLIRGQLNPQCLPNPLKGLRIEAPVGSASWPSYTFRRGLNGTTEPFISGLGVYASDSTTVGIASGGAAKALIGTSGINPGGNNTLNLGADGTEWAQAYVSDIFLGKASSDTGTIKFSSALSAFSTIIQQGIGLANITYTLPVSLGAAGSALLDASGGGALAWGAPTPAAHNILSAQHGDTTAASVVRGDLIAGIGATPKWERLAIGTTGKFLRTNGTDPSWQSIAASDIPNADLIGTANQVILSASGVDTLLGSTNITLSLPQSIATTSTPQFLRMGLGAAADSTKTLFLSVSDTVTATSILEILQASTGDAGLALELSGAVSYALGIDNSDSDKFKISYGATGNAELGTNDYLTIGTDGEVIVPKWLQVGTATDAAAQGDFAAGITGSHTMKFAQASGFAELKYAAAGFSIRNLDLTMAQGAGLAANYNSFGMRWLSNSSTDVQREGIFIVGGLSTVTNASENAFIRLLMIDGGTTRRNMFDVDLATAATVFNEDGQSHTHRFEASGEANALTITGSNGQVLMNQWVRIGTATDAAAQGDLSSGLTGANRFNYDQSDGDIENIFGASTVFMAPGVIFTATASATVGNTTTETTLIGSGVGTVTIPANHLRAGRSYRIRASGYWSYDSGTLRLRIKFGTVVFADTTALTPSVTPVTDRYWEIDEVFTCRTAGGTGTIFAQGAWSHIEDSDNQDEPIWWTMQNTTTQTVDTTAATALAFTALWSAAAVGNTITCTNLEIEALR